VVALVSHRDIYVILHLNSGKRPWMNTISDRCRIAGIKDEQAFA
jgi:hypothetical protein